MKNQDVHLSEDKIIRAIVDENDLTTSEQNHLSKCSICQREKQEFEQVLHCMGDMSKELVPSPQRRFIPVAQGSHSSFRWRPALATGLVIVLLMIGIWWSSLFERFQENGSVQTAQKMQNNKEFITESPFTAKDALPSRYLYIIGDYNDDDYDDDYNDEFLEFALPL